MEDIKIIEMFFARDEKAIAETGKKYGNLCFSIARNILNNHEEAEECVNDTYLGIWNSIPPTRPSNFVAYICKIVRNISLKMFQYNTAKKRSHDMVVSFSEIEEIISDDSFVIEIENKELAEMISNFLWKEKEVSRNVFIRRYWFCESICEIASRYSMRENNVKSMLFRTRIRLKKFLEREGIVI